MEYNFLKNPTIGADCHLHDTAELIGDVTLDAGVFVGPHVSLRADEGTPFRVCKGTNIQDHVTIHGLLDKTIIIRNEPYSVYIGSHCSLAHGCLIHGPTAIGKKTFIGFKAIVHNADIHRNCYIGHGAIVNGVKLPPDTYVPDGTVLNDQSMVAQLPVMPEHIKEFNKEVVDYNLKLCERYSKNR